MQFFIKTSQHLKQKLQFNQNSDFFTKKCKQKSSKAFVVNIFFGMNWRANNTLRDIKSFSQNTGNDITFFHVILIKTSNTESPGVKNS